MRWSMRSRIMTRPGRDFRRRSCRETPLSQSWGETRPQAWRVRAEAVTAEARVTPLPLPSPSHRFAAGPPLPCRERGSRSPRLPIVVVLPLGQERLHPPRRLADAVLVLDQRDADIAFAFLAEADAGRDGDLRLGQQLLGEFDRAEVARSAGGIGAQANMLARGRRESPSRRGRSSRPARRGAPCRGSRLAAMSPAGR